MNLLMIRSRVKPDSVAEVDAGIATMFAAIEREQPKGIRYASCRLGDGVTYVALLAVQDGTENPLPAIAEFRDFQQNLADWVAGPPQAEPMTVVRSYRV